MKKTSKYSLPLLSLVFVTLSFTTCIQSAEEDISPKSLFINHPLIKEHDRRYVDLSTQASLYFNAQKKFDTEAPDFSKTPPKELQKIRIYAIIHLIDAYQSAYKFSQVPIWYRTPTGGCKSCHWGPGKESLKLEKDFNKLMAGASLFQSYCHLPLVSYKEATSEKLEKRDDLAKIVERINDNILKQEKEEQSNQPGNTIKRANSPKQKI